MRLAVTTRRGRRLRAARPGATLVEVCVSIAVLAVVGAAIASAMLAGRRSVAHTGAAVSRDAALRHAAAVLHAELAALDPADSLVLADSAIEATVAVATGVVCAIDGTALVLPPLDPARGAPHVRVATALSPGDVARVLHADPGGDRWASVAVVAAAERRDASLCPPAGGFTTVDDAARPRLRLEVAALPADARVGSAVWIGRRVRWSLYRDGAGEWQLGRRECTRLPRVACAGVQPVAGPLRSFSRDAARSGLAVVALDAAGTPLAPGNAAGAALLGITLRAGTAVRADSAVVWLPVRAP